MPAVTVYSSDDVGAPQLSYSAKSLNNILKACLVNGYGSKLPAGWTLSEETGNVCVFRQGAGSMAYIRSQDDASYYANWTCGSTFGTYNSPGKILYHCKTITTSTTTYRPWLIFASDRSCYIWTAYNRLAGEANTPSTEFNFFGDIISYRPNDSMKCAMIARNSATTSSSNVTIGYGDLLDSSVTYEIGNRYLMKDYLGLNINRPFVFLKAVNSTYAGNSGSIFPDPVTGGLIISRFIINELNFSGTPVFRGHMPGIFNPLHNNPGVHGDIYPGTGSLGGSELMLIHRGGTDGKIAVSLNPADW